MSGTANIARDLWDDPTFKDGEMTQREAWIWMVCQASWKARVKRFGSQEIRLERGQLIGSSRFLAAAWMWSEPRVRRYLDMLENRRMIARVTDAGVTVITICKYDIYQNKARAADAPVTHQPTHQRRTSDANHNKGEIREYIGGGGSARTCEAESDPPRTPDHPTQPEPAAAPPCPVPTWREQLLDAMGVDRSGLTGYGGQMIGTEADMLEARRWLSDLKLNASETLIVVAEVMARKRDGPPSSFRFFNRAMQRFAADKAAAAVPLSPAQSQSNRPSHSQPDVAAIMARLEAEGRI